MSRVRWGNVAQLAALTVAVALIAFGTPDGCGSEPEVIPLDALPGEPVETAALPRAPRAPSVSAPRPTHERRRSRPVRRKAPRPRMRAAQRVVQVAGSGTHARAGALPRVPEAAREFSFDR